MPKRGCCFIQKIGNGVDLVWINATVPDGLDHAHEWKFVVGHLLNPPDGKSIMTGVEGVKYRVSHGRSALEFLTRDAAEFLVLHDAGMIELEPIAEAAAFATAAA